MWFNTIHRIVLYDTGIYLSQVKTILKAAAAEGVGESASGASDKIQEAADAALADIAKASERWE